MPKARMKVDKRCVDAIRRAIEEKLDEACDKVKDEVLPGVAADVIEKSRLEVPTYTGTLRNSGYALDPEYNKQTGDVHVTVGYGGPNDQVHPETGIPASGYALDQHENLSYTHDPGQKAKYLEDPVRLESARFKEIIMDAIKEVF